MINDWIPENEQEAERKFKELYKDSPHGDLITKCMSGILHCRIKQGEPFIKAYENTLKYYIKNTDSKDLI